MMCDETGSDTCVHLAIRHEHVTILRLLILAKASVSETNRNGDIPYHLYNSLITLITLIIALIIAIYHPWITP